MREDWNFMDGPNSVKATPVFGSGRNRAKGVYATNGGMFAVIKKSRQDRRLPDLFCLEFVDPFRRLLSRLFETRFPSIKISHLDRFESAHGEPRRNSDFAIGRSARSAAINFRYFDEGSDPSWRGSCRGGRRDKIRARHQLGVGATRPHRRGSTCPAIDFQSDEELRDFVRNNAWGHHASCTCPIGKKERAAS